MATLLQLLFSGLEIGSIYALASLGIMLIFRTSSVTNFAQGIIGMFGGFVTAAIIMGAFNVSILMENNQVILPNSERFMISILLGVLLWYLIKGLFSKLSMVKWKILSLSIGIPFIFAIITFILAPLFWDAIAKSIIVNNSLALTGFVFQGVTIFVIPDSSRMVFTFLVALFLMLMIGRTLQNKKITFWKAYGISGIIGLFYIVTQLVIGNNIWSATLIALTTAVIVGLLIDYLIIRRAQKVNPLAKQIITMGIVIVFLGITPMVFDKMLVGADPISIPKFFPSGAINIIGASLSYNSLFNIVVGLIILVFLFWFLQKTRWGLAVRVTASNPQTARMMGVPVKLVTLGSWAIAAMLATLAAVMYAPNVGILNPGYMTSIQVIAFVACIFGGFQTFHGPVLASYILAVVRNLLIFYGATMLNFLFIRVEPDFGSVWGEQILYIMILVLVIFRPYGLIGKKVIKKV
jgi:branched-chain amino acid transport system permease protein